jgi:hypothetical protein
MIITTMNQSAHLLPQPSGPEGLVTSGKAQVDGVDGVFGTHRQRRRCERMQGGPDRRRPDLPRERREVVLLRC